MELFAANGVKKIITTSPHCLWSFKNDYSKLGAEWEVFHYTEILSRLVAEGKITPSTKSGKKIVVTTIPAISEGTAVYMMRPENF